MSAILRIRLERRASAAVWAIKAAIGVGLIHYRSKQLNVMSFSFVSIRFSIENSGGDGFDQFFINVSSF